MAIESFGFDSILAKLGARKSGLSMDDRILRELKLIGEEACNMARDTYKGGNPNDETSHQDGGYDDNTRNLRGSIAYVISFMGKEIARGGFDGRGSAEGEENASAALGAVSVQGSLWEISVVAGMHYARYVEAKGYPVITFVQSWLDGQVKQLIDDIKNGKL